MERQESLETCSPRSQHEQVCREEAEGWKTAIEWVLTIKAGENKSATGLIFEQCTCGMFETQLLGDSTHLGVDGDLHRFCRIRSRIDVHVAHALAVPQHGYLRRSLGVRQEHTQGLGQTKSLPRLIGPIDGGDKVFGKIHPHNAPHHHPTDGNPDASQILGHPAPA